MKNINILLLIALTAAVMMGCTKESQSNALNIALDAQGQFERIGAEYRADLRYTVYPASSGNIHAEVRVDGDPDGIIKSEIHPGTGQYAGTVSLSSPRRLPDGINVTLRVSEDGRIWYESNPVGLQFKTDIWTVIPEDPEE